MKISVETVPGGWIVVGGATMGPFMTKQRAVELAQGMAEALAGFGETVELVVDDETPSDAA